MNGPSSMPRWLFFTLLGLTAICAFGGSVTATMIGCFAMLYGLLVDIWIQLWEANHRR